MNLWGLKGRCMENIQSLRAAFSGAVRLVEVERSDNSLLFAFGPRQVAGLPDFLEDRARYLEQGLGLEFSRYIQRLRAAAPVS